MGAACSHHASAGISAARAHIHNVVRSTNDIQVVFDNNDRCSLVSQVLKDFHERLHIKRM